jgi:hypothetical protein
MRVIYIDGRGRALERETYREVVHLVEEGRINRDSAQELLRARMRKVVTIQANERYL